MVPDSARSGLETCRNETLRHISVPKAFRTLQYISIHFSDIPRFPIFEEVPCVLASLVPDGLTEELLPMGLDISLAVPDFQKSEIGKLLPDAWYGSSEPRRTGYIYIYPWVVLGF